MADVGRFAELIDQHSPAMMLFARQWCHTPEDATQLAFCKLMKQTIWPNDPAAWLFQVVRTTAIDLGKAERRRKTRENATARPEPWFHQTAIDSVDADDIVVALQALSHDQREVIVLRLWSDLTLEQIAKACSCSVSSAHRRYEAGIAELRKIVGVKI